MNAPNSEPPTIEERPQLPKHLNTLGLAITGVWLLLMLSYALAVWDDLLAMAPNEFGDLLAGTFAPLAFLWLVLGFFQQGEELRNSSRALWLQGEELRNSVEQQRQLVEATREQLQLERETLSHERNELARTSAPILRLTTGGNVGSGDGKRMYDFRVTNLGKRCTGLKVHFEGNDSMPGGAAWDSLDTGGAEVFRIILPAQDDRELTVVIQYLDERMMPGTQRFIVQKRGSNFTVENARD